MEEVQRGVNISYSSQPVYRKYAAENIQLQRHCAQSRIQHKAESVSQSLKCSCREEYYYWIELAKKNVAEKLKSEFNQVKTRQKKPLNWVFRFKPLCSDQREREIRFINCRQKLFYPTKWRGEVEQCAGHTAVILKYFCTKMFFWNTYFCSLSCCLYFRFSELNRKS